MRRVTVLGATGSIGQSTLDVIGRHPDRFALHAVTAERNWEALAEICVRFQPEWAVIVREEGYRPLLDRLADRGCRTRVACGREALATVAADPSSDTVVAAIVGAAGLLPALAAVRAGKRVLLANKEALVMSGRLFMEAVRSSGAQLLPIDSEHNAIFQCLPPAAQHGQAEHLMARHGVRRLLLTASGGPFLETPAEQLCQVTPEQACRHPRWDMGRKISVDSATLMNKGLELIEACWLFDVGVEQVEVHVHPQAIVHSMVEYIDGSILAQLGSPDMRTPIANALAFPERIDAGVPGLDLFSLGGLSFQAPDLARFPCLRLAADAHRAGGAAAVVLNAANEIAVAAFLERRLGFTGIPEVIEATLGALAGHCRADGLEDILAVDAEARGQAVQLIERRTG